MSTVDKDNSSNVESEDEKIKRELGTLIDWPCSTPEMAHVIALEQALERLKTSNTTYLAQLHEKTTKSMDSGPEDAKKREQECIANFFGTAKEPQLTDASLKIQRDKEIFIKSLNGLKPEDFYIYSRTQGWKPAFEPITEK